MTPDLGVLAVRHEVIVLEGCDGAGKTTLAVAPATGHGYQMVHAARTPDGIDLAERYTSILTWPGRLVLDRSFVSELVYGPLIHGRSRLTFDQAAGLAAIVTGRGGVLVHLTGRPEHIRARLEDRDGIAPDLHHIRDLVARYTAVFTRLADHAPILTIDAA